MDREGEVKWTKLFNDVLLVGILIDDDKKLCFSEGNELHIYSIEENPLAPLLIRTKGARSDISAILDAGDGNLLLGLSWGFCQIYNYKTDSMLDFTNSGMSHWSSFS
jgi:hypothetical protein